MKKVLFCLNLMILPFLLVILTGCFTRYPTPTGKYSSDYNANSDIKQIWYELENITREEYEKLNGINVFIDPRTSGKNKKYLKINMRYLTNEGVKSIDLYSIERFGEYRDLKLQTFGIVEIDGTNQEYELWMSVPVLWDNNVRSIEAIEILNENDEPIEEYLMFREEEILDIIPLNLGEYSSYEKESDVIEDLKLEIRKPLNNEVSSIKENTLLDPKTMYTEEKEYLTIQVDVLEKGKTNYVTLNLKLECMYNEKYEFIINVDESNITKEENEEHIYSLRLFPKKDENRIYYDLDIWKETHVDGKIENNIIFKSKLKAI